LRALAAFVMRGRFQALLVAVVAATSLLFSWVSAAVVALVTLRRGAAEGAWLLMWAVLPASVLLYAFGDSSPLTLLLGTAALALTLRGTVSLSLTLLSAVGVGLATGFVLLTLGAAYLLQLEAFFEQVFAGLQQQMAGERSDLPPLLAPGVVQIAGLLGLMTAMGSVLCLLLARYWQAALYNPGGFAREFQALRYPAGVAVLLALCTLVTGALGLELRSWASLFMVPLMAAGFALIHSRARVQRSSGVLLGLVYVGWLLFDVAKLAVALLALADSFFDFRARWAARGSPPQRGSDDKDSE
jgi:hypothetical protein